MTTTWERDSTVEGAYAAAAEGFVDLVGRIPADAWAGPGLGAWDLRSLVGHASRALSTVITYLERPAEHEDIPGPEVYFALVSRHPGEAEAVVERGRGAGADLGDDPAGRVRELADEAVRAVAARDPDALVTTIGGGMRVRTYLPTRTFELVVHSEDIAAASGIEVVFGAPVLSHVAELAARTAVERDEGRILLAALTGRRPLPAGFSVVP